MGIVEQHIDRVILDRPPRQSVAITPGTSHGRYACATNAITRSSSSGTLRAIGVAPPG